MSSLGSPNPFFIAGKKAYEVERSLRFNDDDSAHLSRTPSSASNRKTWTISAWVKRGNISTATTMFNAYDGSSSRRFQLTFESTDKLNFNQGGSASSGLANSDMVFRDTNAWYHLVFVADYTNGTAADRFKVYVNGSEISLTFSDDVENADGQWNGNWEHEIGAIGSTNQNFDGYMAEINVIDGQAYDSSYFGETDVLTGQWNPKKYTGSYGTNGFYLNFSDNSGTTATTLGKDSSGNGNNFTPNNFSVSAGAGNDSVEDTPTNNFPTLNPLNINPYSSSGYPSPTFTNGNLTFTTNTTSQVNYAESSFYFPATGKWYLEVVINNLNIGSGVGYLQALTIRSATSGSYYLWWVYSSPYYQINTGSGLVTINAPSNGDVLQLAFDADTGKTWFGNNNTWYLSGDPATGTAMSSPIVIAGDDVRFSVSGRSGSAANIVDVNFGQRAFSYTPPTGFKALNSANLPDPTILLPNKHFDTLLYTGNGSSQTLSGLNFAPDWVWIKIRSQSYDHAVFDTIRGATKDLEPNQTGAEQTRQMLTAFTSDGFSVGNDTQANKSGDTFVAWNWDAGDTDGKTYTVTVVDDSGNKYRFDGFGTSAVTLDLAEGGTYIFNYPSAHPFRFSTTADGTHGGGSEYTTGVTHNSSTQVTIVVAASAPTLYYYCSSHSGMGGQVNTNSTLGSSNFDGSIQSTVKVNATAGFSIVSYAGNQSSAYTIGHGLGVAPNIIIAKSRTDAVNWGVYYSILGTNTNYMTLNTTDAQGANNNSEMSGVFAVLNSSTVQMSYTAFGDVGSSLIMYAFSEVAGYSKFGSYTGNGNADGPFVFTGFRPAWIMIKISGYTGNWIIFDNKRDPFNYCDTRLFANLSNADTGSYNVISMLSNGFKFENQYDGSWNRNNTQFIYLAFAESPFKNARAR